jgi:hypothetical protein
MSSNPPSAAASSKSATASGQLSPAQSQAGSVATSDSYGQRRSGGLGSFGAGAASRASPSPRNNQAARKQHKGSKRFRLADEDALAETVSANSSSFYQNLLGAYSLYSYRSPCIPSTAVKDKHQSPI